jgi:hypothetical protein
MVFLTMTKHISSDYLKAGDPLTHSDELLRLAAQEPEAAIRRRLAENPSTPLAVLSSLAVDEDVDVRIAVSGNPLTPQWLRSKLSHDDSPTVRVAVAEDPYTPLTILKRLADDENAYVQHQAKRTIDVVELEIALAEEDFLVEPGEHYKLGVLLVAAHLLTQNQVEELLRIAKDKGIPFGQAIARMKALPKQKITQALLLQSKLRRNEISELDVIKLLKHR